MVVLARILIGSLQIAISLRAYEIVTAKKDVNDMSDWK